MDPYQLLKTDWILIYIIGFQPGLFSDGVDPDSTLRKRIGSESEEKFRSVSDPLKTPIIRIRNHAFAESD